MMGRLLVWCATAVAGLVLAGAAPTAVSTPPGRIVVGTAHGKAGAGVTFQILSSADVAEPAQVTLYLPAGYAVDLARAPGSKIGSVFALIADGDTSIVGSATGIVSVADPSSPAPGVACAPGPHAAVWDASFTGGPTVRLYVDPTTGAETAFGAYKLVACFASTYTTGTPRPLVFSVALADGTTPVITPPANGNYLWRMFVTPFVDGTATVDTAATFEARTHVLAPHALSERAAYRVKSQRLLVRGRLTGLGRPRGHVTVTLLGGPKSGDVTLLGRVRTRADGSYAFSTRVRQSSRSRVFSVWALIEERVAPCVGASTAPAGCVDESVSPPAEQTARVTIPKLRRRR